jgi:NAD+-dependent farnesol dehydrogenase
MEILVTGATGFIGKNLVQALIKKGDQVRVLYRNAAKTADLQISGVSFYKGDITDKRSLEEAMQSCTYVFHLAAYAKVWSREADTYEKINVQGTINVLEAAIACGIKKVLVTSTAGVFGPSGSHAPVDEETKRIVPYFSEYERTKDKADYLLMEQYATQIPLTIVCPPRVYGPGEISQSNSVTRILELYSRGKFRIIPGDGEAIGNYVYVDDVVNGMVLALEKGKTGERYILGGENVTYSDFFATLAEVTGKKCRMIKLPAGIILFIARIMKAGADLFGIPPLITPGWAGKYLYNWEVSSSKAEKDLGYKPRSLNEGMELTWEWLKGKALPDVQTRA